jgi:predicted nucleic acid-binding protein
VIAVDTSVLIDFSKGTSTRETVLLEKCLNDGTVVLPEPVLFEVISGPAMSAEVEAVFLSLPRLVVLSEFWERSGRLRKKLLKKKQKARAVDCLIAQMCIDHNVALITSDKDFQKFVTFELKLA